MRGRVIHYIDDDKDDLAIFKTAVDQINIPVQLNTHTNPVRFMQIISSECKERPLIFLDINMPDKSGFDLLKDIRKNIECKDVPVIMLSTSEDPASIMVSRDLGADRYVVKPNSMTKLKSIIKRITDLEWSKNQAYIDDFVLSV